MNSKMKGTVLRVGEGRGFVVADKYGTRFAIAAAHCLPFFPPCSAATYACELIYTSLLAPLSGAPKLSAECLFADPISDIAVLGRPENTFEQYESFMDSLKPFSVGRARPQESASVLSLSEHWVPVSLSRQINGPVWIEPGRRFVGVCLVRP